MVYSFLFISVRTYLDYCDIYTIHPLLISLYNNYRKYKKCMFSNYWCNYWSILGTLLDRVGSRGLRV